MRIIKCDMCHEEIKNKCNLFTVTFNNTDEVMDLCENCYNTALSFIQRGGSLPHPGPSWPGAEVNGRMS